MRDRRYIAQHRGGPLSLEEHRMLASWAAGCAERVVPLFDAHVSGDDRLLHAIRVARAWSRGDATVGEARASSVAAHAAARNAGNQAAICAARAAGHAVASAHMADHAPGAAWYARKAIEAAVPENKRNAMLKNEHEWQKKHLPKELHDLVLSTIRGKGPAEGC